MQIDMPKRYKSGVYIQYKNSTPEVIYFIRGLTIAEIRVLSEKCPEFLVLPDFVQPKAFSKHNAGDYDYKIGQNALKGIDNPTLVLTGAGRCLIESQNEEKNIKLILPRDQSLYYVSRRYLDIFDYKHENYFLVAESGRSGSYGTNQDSFTLTDEINDQSMVSTKVAVEENYSFDSETQELYPKGDLIDDI